MGGTFPGSPFVHVGFNENLGWGATVNQPDLSDIYELKLNPENNDQYELDVHGLILPKRIKNLKLNCLALSVLHILYKCTIQHMGLF